MTDPIPHNGRLILFKDIADQIREHHQNPAAARGLSTGWPAMDEYMRLARGQLTIITGIPSSGKSEWIDHLMLNTIALHDWHWTIFSPENWPLPAHFQKLAEKWLGKPMFQQSEYRPGMTMAEIELATTELSGGIACIEPGDGAVTLEGVMAVLKKGKEDYNSTAFLLDPWNELEHHRPPQITETEYIGKMLTMVRNFGRLHDMAIFIVAHPTKLQKRDDGKYPIPTPYDISGSSNWRNKADFCISVWRDYEENTPVKISIQKVRNKNLGKTGAVDLHWRHDNGLFYADRERRDSHTQPGVRANLCRAQRYDDVF